MGMPMQERHPLEGEIRAFERKEAELEKSSPGKFVLFKDGAFVGAWDRLDVVAQQAGFLFGKGPYLIRRVAGRARTQKDQVISLETIIRRPFYGAGYYAGGGLGLVVIVALILVLIGRV
jgi:Protein of unknown function (DUF3309)